MRISDEYDTSYTNPACAQGLRDGFVTMRHFEAIAGWSLYHHPPAMRLLLITDTYPPEINGVARTLSTLARGLTARGHAVEVITTRAAESAEPEGAPARHVVPSLPLPGYPGLRVGLATRGRLLRLFERFQPDVLYVATETPLGLAAIRAARRAGVPVVSGFHTNFQTYLGDYGPAGLASLARPLLRALHNRTARTLTPSADTAAMLTGWGVRNVGVLGRGVDTRLFDPARRCAELRRTWGADDATPVALYVGRVAAEKNLDLLVRAFQAFRAIHPQAPCVVVGDGPRRQALQAAQPDFIFAGARPGEELARHYASADVFLFPSVTETFGNVVLEALAAGLLPVAYDYAGPRQLIRHGTSGWLAPLGDEAAFLDGTRAAAAGWNDATRRANTRAAALKHGWPQVIEQFEAELRAVLPARP
jgi:glycosyltransferase involved in cell wall biosynthesis